MSKIRQIEKLIQGYEKRKYELQNLDKRIKSIADIREQNILRQIIEDLITILK